MTCRRNIVWKDNVVKSIFSMLKLPREISYQHIVLLPNHYRKYIVTWVKRLSSNLKVTYAASYSSRVSMNLGPILWYYWVIGDSFHEIIIVPSHIFGSNSPEKVMAFSKICHKICPQKTDYSPPDWVNQWDLQ